MIQELQRFHRFVTTHPIGSRNPSGAWAQWLKWQIGSRILRMPVIVPWLGGASLVVERGMTGATGNLYCGLHEFNDMALLIHYFGGGGGRLLDVGANIGSYTVLAAKVCGAEVISIEPVPLSCARLERNIAVNRIGHLVEVHCVAMGAEAGEILFSSDCDTTNQVVDDSYQGTAIRVPVCPLDEILAGRTAGFWKVDVEGFERQVLDGAKKALLDEDLEIVLLEGDDDSIQVTMQDAGFSKRCYDPFKREFSMPSIGGPNGNHVWVRESEGLLRRLKSAPLQVVHGVEF